MGQENVIARRYAKGLAELAAEGGNVPGVRRGVRLLADILDSRSGKFRVPEFADFLSSPTVDAGDKLKMAESVLKKAGVDKTVSDFFAVLIRRGRAGLMPRIAQEFSVFAGDLTGERTAVVHTARELTPEQRGRLEGALAKSFGGVVHIHERVEPGLLAGARVTVGDSTFDGTVLGKLERMRDELTTDL